MNDSEKKEPNELNNQIIENQKLISSLNEKVLRKTNEVQIIQSISTEILNNLDLEKIFEKTMLLLDEVFGFKHSMILLKEESKNLVKVVACRGYEANGIGAVVEFGKGVIGIVAQKKKILRMVGINTHMRYMKLVKENIDEKPKEIIVLPGLKNAKSQIGIPLLIKDKLIGIYAVESEEMNAFKAIDEMTLNIVSNQIATAIDNASAYQTQRMLTEAYSRFVPKEFLTLIKKKSILETKLADQHQGEYTILFSDIRDFTRISEELTPADNFLFINDYLGYIAPVINKHNGFIDKYIGDAIMAIFPRKPIDAIKASIEMLEQLALFNNRWEPRHGYPIRIGIGMHTGNIMAGIIGAKDHMEGTFIGDGVNLASRLEGLTKELKCKVIASSTTIQSLPEFPNIPYESLGEVSVKGKEHKVTVYKIA